MIIGLRIDVDTLRGTKHGVPNLCRLLASHSLKATFFFSLGPDNMGRHMWRLIRPDFIRKMLRSRAANLYGWDILLKGTLWPGPVIGEKCAGIIRSVSDAGHEVGLHAWDHHAWQRHIDHMDADGIRTSLKSGEHLFEKIIGRRPTCSAVPGWKCNDLVLLEKAGFSFAYNSDCRGTSIFRPVVDGKELKQPQIPVTLPTYDELIGHEGISHNNYNDYLLSLLKPEGLNILTIHAEVEGMVCMEMFERFLTLVQSKGGSFAPLGEVFSQTRFIDCSTIIPEKIPGRDGWVACQSEAMQCEKGRES